MALWVGGFWGAALLVTFLGGSPGAGLEPGAFSDLRASVQSHGESLANMYKYFRKTDYFWKWFNRNKNVLNIILASEDGREISESVQKSVEDRFSELEDKVLQNSKENQKLSSILNNHKGDKIKEIEELKERLDVLNMRIEGLYTQSTSHDSSMSSLRNEVARIEEEVDAVRRKVDRKEKVKIAGDALFGVVNRLQEGTASSRRRKSAKGRRKKWE